jgi:hypothetical protein
VAGGRAIFSLSKVFFFCCISVKFVTIRDIEWREVAPFSLSQKSFFCWISVKVVTIRDIEWREVAPFSDKSVPK